MARWRWLILTVVFVVISLVAVHRSRRAGGLPEIATVPTFTFTDHRGEPFSSHHLAGRVWIANFMFTSCPDVCPLLTQRMLALRNRLEGESIHFVSFTVDPEADTPEVLKKYAIEQGAHHENWSFLTGELDAVRKVVVDGFKQSMEKLREEGKPLNVLHGSHFVLVDSQGIIRGYYASDRDGADEIVPHASFLADHRGP